MSVAVWKSKFGRCMPSTQPNSLVDFHTGYCPAGHDARGRPSLPRRVPGGRCGDDRRACCRRGHQYILAGSIAVGGLGQVHRESDTRWEVSRDAAASGRGVGPLAIAHLVCLCKSTLFKETNKLPQQLNTPHTAAATSSMLSTAAPIDFARSRSRILTKRSNSAR